MNSDKRLLFYQLAKTKMQVAGYSDEILWQATRSPELVQPVDFLCEAAWVVINSGFREQVARRIFPALALCFCDWQPTEILDSEDGCRLSALNVFAHAGKVNAIIEIARTVDTSWEQLKRDITESPIGALQSLPYIGPVTAYHLAKNLGYPCAKADRHLKRTARSLGHECVQQLCQEIALASGDPIGLVDLILWRYAVDGKPNRKTA